MAQPKKVFRNGTCRAAIFQNEGKRDGRAFQTYSVSFQRHYKDKEGKWQVTSSLNPNDIPKAVLVLQKAYDYLTSAETETDE